MTTGTIKQIPSFRTTDGILHETRLEALQHQFELDLRSVFSGTTVVSWSPNSAAFVVAKNLNKVDELIRSYRPRIQAAMKSAQSKTATV